MSEYTFHIKSKDSPRGMCGVPRKDAVFAASPFASNCPACVSKYDMQEHEDNIVDDMDNILLEEETEPVEIKESPSKDYVEKETDKRNWFQIITGL